MQDGAAASAAARDAHVQSGGAVSSAAGSDGTAASAQQPSRLRLPGPAITVEPSAEAVAAVQALFARQPQLVAEAGQQQLADGAACAGILDADEFAAGATASLLRAGSCMRT
jgi:hypothetical protein